MENLENKNYKEKVSLLKKEIKLRGEIQVLNRKLRKTVYNPYSAEQQKEFVAKKEELYNELFGIIGKPKWGYGDNKWELRHLHIAYRIVRGKEPTYPVKKEYSQQKINEIVDKFQTETSMVQ